jgi:hypothetical protein
MRRKARERHGERSIYFSIRFVTGGCGSNGQIGEVLTPPSIGGTINPTSRRGYPVLCKSPESLYPTPIDLGEVFPLLGCGGTV